jgi:hypothetical protein
LEFAWLGASIDESPMPKKRNTSPVALIHWNEAEARLRIAATRLKRFHLEHLPLVNGSDRSAWKTLRDTPPAVVLIDLSRLPSHGREVGLTLRQTKATAHLPIVFVSGAPEKVAATREKLPEAQYCEWPDCEKAIERAIAAPVPPPQPRDALCSTAPLAQKLGVKEGSRVLLVGAPKDFAATLGSLPRDATTTSKATGTFDVVLFFTKEKATLRGAIERYEPLLADRGGLWIAWPKKASKVPTDITEDTLRDVALPMGLVDNKVCAIDATWSGLRFARRRAH